MWSCIENKTKVENPIVISTNSDGSCKITIYSRDAYAFSGDYLVRKNINVRQWSKTITETTTYYNKKDFQKYSELNDFLPGTKNFISGVKNADEAFLNKDLLLHRLDGPAYTKKFYDIFPGKGTNSDNKLIYEYYNCKEDKAREQQFLYFYGRVVDEERFIWMQQMNILIPTEEHPLTDADLTMFRLTFC